MTFQIKLTAFISSLIIVVTTILGFSFYWVMADALKSEIGDRALSIASTLANNDSVRAAFASRAPWQAIDPVVRPIQLNSKADFITVANRDGVRYWHMNPELINKPMADRGGSDFLRGKSLVYESRGSLGPSLRARTPIFDNNGRVIGLVSVGFLMEGVEREIRFYMMKVALFGIAALAVGAGGTLAITRGIRRAIHGLEPEQIGRLYREQQAILESVREGIIAVDIAGKITLANRNAAQLLKLEHPEMLPGTSADMSMERFPLLVDMLSEAGGSAPQDQEMMLEEETLVISRIPVKNEQGRISGMIVSIRDKNELYRLTEQLTEVRHYADALRAQTHEYANKLYVISGLLQLECYKEAIQFIHEQFDTEIRQYESIHVRKLAAQVGEPAMASLLAGKQMLADEQGIALDIVVHPPFHPPPDVLDWGAVLTVTGNLVDNAIEAAAAEGGVERRVAVHLEELAGAVRIRIRDFGPGVPGMDASVLFIKGHTTKPGPGHGYGMFLVSEALQSVNGSIQYAQPADGGTEVVVQIPFSRPI